MTNRNHEMHDDCADWAIDNVRPFIAQGCDQQGRHVPTIPAEACTELGAETKPRLGPVKRWERWTIKNPASSVYLLMGVAVGCAVVMSYSASVLADLIAWGTA